MQLRHVTQQHGLDCARENFQAGQMFRSGMSELIVVTAGGLCTNPYGQSSPAVTMMRSDMPDLNIWPA